MTNRHPKCQSNNPDRCTDPQCPERRGYRAEMSNARNYQEFEVGATKQKEDQARQRRQQFEQQASTYRPKQEFTHDGDPVIKFHKDVGFPSNYSAPQGSREVIYSRHAEEEAQKDIYGVIPKLTRVNLNSMELIELKVNAKTRKAYRYLYRAELDDNTDICLVLQPAGAGKMRVITNWLNDKSDAHRTLNRSEYVQPRVKQTA